MPRIVGAVTANLLLSFPLTLDLDAWNAGTRLLRVSPSRSEQRPDARGQRHGEGSPERDTHRACGSVCTTGERSHTAQEREECQ